MLLLSLLLLSTVASSAYEFKGPSNESWNLRMNTWGKTRLTVTMTNKKSPELWIQCEYHKSWPGQWMSFTYNRKDPTRPIYMSETDEAVVFKITSGSETKSFKGFVSPIGVARVELLRDKDRWERHKKNIDNRKFKELIEHLKSSNDTAVLRIDFPGSDSRKLEFSLLEFSQAYTWVSSNCGPDTHDEIIRLLIESGAR